MDTSLVIATLSLAGTLIVAALTYRVSRQATRVDERAGELQWVKEMRADAKDARADVAALQEQVASLKRELNVASREAEHLAEEMMLWRRTAWRPGMTIDRYREFIGPPPPAVTANGRTS